MFTRDSFRSLRRATFEVCALLAMLLVGPPAQADDVEIYLSPQHETVNPNVLFVLDESLSMRWGASSYCSSNCRIDQLKEAMTTILDSSSMENINVAMMGFTNAFSGQVTRATCSMQEQEHQCGTEPTTTCTTETTSYQCGTQPGGEECDPPVCGPVCGEPVCTEQCDQVCTRWWGWWCVSWGESCHTVCDDPVCTTECADPVCHPVDEPVYCEGDVEVCTTEDTPVYCTEEVEVCDTEPVSVSGETSMVYSDFVRVTDVSRDALLSVVNGLGTYGTTPTVQALRDAVDWYDGSFTDLSGRTYSSPIQLWCQPNHIVLLTDGQPNYNEPAPSSHGGLTSYAGSSCAWDSVNTGDGSITYGSSYSVDGHWVTGDSPQDGRCAPEIASWAFATDLRTGTDWEDIQNVHTHTIGFYTDAQAEGFLANVAANGGGDFYTADTASELVDAFEDILADAAAPIDYTYTAPAIPMDSSNTVVSGDKIYVPLIKPDTKVFWKGNLKKYIIETDENDNIVLKGADGQPVLDSDYLFLDSARDLWSSSVDGADPLAGGAASKLTGARNLYTYLDSSGTTKNLTAAVNAVSVDNAGITAAMLGAADAAERATLLNWIATGRGEMGAPLHTKPKVVTYSGGEQLVLLPTSEGTVHAIDADDGTEVWAYMPDELLSELKAIKANASNVGPPIYGLDGPTVIVHDDIDGDTLIDPGESAYIVVGMRRGGRNYYALDISSRTAPAFAWEIKGGIGDFARLGQTWSAPQIGNLTIGGSTRKVLAFGGGYDADQDNVTGARTADDVGNAVYVVDAATGARLKWISNSGADLGISQMTNSIPANLAMIDVDADGLSDRIYAADVGGRILRIDLGDTDSGGVIADVNSGDAVGNRRFFYAPDVAYVSKGGTRYLALVVGSGFIPEPEDTTVQDRFYMIKDYDVFDVPKDGQGNVAYTTLIESSLYDATQNLIQDAATEEERDAAIAALASKMGWYINMASGEKVFSPASVYDYIVLFSTYTVTEGTGATGEDDCSVNSIVGEGSIYAIYLLNATALFEGMDGNSSLLDVNDRSKTLAVPGLPPEPAILYPSTADGAPSGAFIAIGGLEEIVSWPDRFRALYWEEVLQ